MLSITVESLAGEGRPNWERSDPLWAVPDVERAIVDSGEDVAVQVDQSALG